MDAQRAAHAVFIGCRRVMAKNSVGDRRRGHYVPRVKLPVKTDYAARAVLELAKQPTGAPARKVDDLAGEVGTSANYLVQILIDLKAAGLVSSTRGKQGGYQLAKTPEEITLGDVWRAVDGEVLDSPALDDERCAPVLRSAWGQLKTSLNEAADTITFAKLVEASGRDKEMYYI
jgi:Rrf2 family cysteine metabolism transcriptional repressor